MRVSWLFGALVCFIMGIVFSITLIGLIVGIPLIILSLILLLFGILIPQPRVIHVHHHRR